MECRRTSPPAYLAQTPWQDSTEVEQEPLLARISAIQCFAGDTPATQSATTTVLARIALPSAASWPIVIAGDGSQMACDGQAKAV